ncbi:MAG: hypothetical protein GY715_06690 [Planctomycetes bacterium]|nr:hypothetical protein [Planctomycetota bacterium]
MSEGEVTEITLRALEGAPLADSAIRDMVVATAHAIAERQGLEVARIHAEDDHITVRLRAGRVEAVGLALELRRLTTRWYTQKYGTETLWGEPSSSEEEGEEWS